MSATLKRNSIYNVVLRTTEDNGKREKNEDADNDKTTSTISVTETSPFVPFPCNAFCRLACTGSLPHSLNATTELKITFFFTLAQLPHPKKNTSRVNLAFSGNFQQFLK